VATDEHVRLSRGKVRDLLEEACRRGPEAAALSRQALELLDTPRLLLTSERAGDSDWAERLDVLAGRQGSLHRVQSADHHLVFTSVSPPAAQPSQDRAVRFTARLLAEQTGGAAADLAANVALGAGVPPALERSRFVMADEWVVAFVNLDRMAAERLQVETTGLQRFGLPDLSIETVPGDRVLTAVNLLRALSYRLLSDHWAWLASNPGQEFRRLSTTQVADSADLWRFWGARPVGEGGLPVRLVADRSGCPGCSPLLDVQPPPDRDPAAWWKDAFDLIPPLTEVRPDPSSP
jgi:hypothetical protein